MNKNNKNEDFPYKTFYLWYKKRGGAPRKYYFYTIEDAKRKNINNIVKSWRECKTGDWVLTDNNYVTKVIKRWKLYIRIACGVYHTKYYGFKFIATNKKFSGYYYYNCLEPESKKKLRQKKKDFLDLLFELGKWKDANYQFKKNTGNEYSLELFLKYIKRYKEIYREVMERFKEEALKVGAGYTWVFEAYKKIAIESKSDKFKIEAIDRIRDLLRMMEEQDNEPSNGNFIGSLKGETAKFQEIPPKTQKFLKESKSASGRYKTN